MTTTREERADKAVVNFRRIQGTLSSFARVLTGKNIRVEMGDETATDGKRIFIRPPISLGDDLRHQRSLCEKYDEYDVSLCQACREHDKLMALLYHEISHNAFGSFAELNTGDIKRAIGAARLGEFATKKMQLNVDRFVAARKSPPGNMIFAAINPFVPSILNAIEDVRIDNRMHDARPGTRVMRKAVVRSTMVEGIQVGTGTYFWKDRPLNAQAIIACYNKGIDLSVPDALVAEANAFAEVEYVAKEVQKVQRGLDVRDSVVATLRILVEGQRYGFFKTDNPDHDYTSDVDPEEPEESGGGAGGEAGEGEEPSPEESDSEPSGDASEEKSDEDAGDDSGSDGGADATPGGEGDGESETEPSPGDGADPEGDSRPADADSGDDAGEPGDDSQPGGGGSEDGTEGSSDSEDDKEDGGDGVSESGEEADGAPGLEPAGGGPDSGTEQARDVSDEGGEGEAAADDRLSEGGTEGDGTSSGDVPSGDERGDDSGESDEAGEGDEGGAVYESDIDGDGEALSPERLLESLDPEGFEFGTAREVESDVDTLIGHDAGYSGGSLADETPFDRQEVDKAVVSSLHFDTRSRAISGVNIYRSWRGAGYRKIRDAVPESLIAPSLLRARVVFTDNMRGGVARNRRSGRVDSRTLGRRAWSDDDRLFKRKTLPGKKDWAVLIGLDISGSTARALGRQGKRQLVDMILAAGYAQAELCQRLGLKFAVYAHTGSRSSLSIFEVKAFNQPWNADAMKKLSTLTSQAVNLDGHTLEFYRKRLDEVQATDKVLMYYSDGAMPAENFAEELEILEREIEVCRKRNYTLMGVGVKSSDPEKYGMDTVRIDTLADLGKVVTHLGKKIAERSS